jgi:predicted Holliday junction resolvase-like endonuclease
MYLLLILLVIVGFAFYIITTAFKAEAKVNNLYETLGKLEEQVTVLNKDIDFWKQQALDNQVKWEAEKTKNSTVVSQKQSVLVRTGAMVENVIPLLQELPYDSKNLHHLGQPIDYLYFDYDAAEIVFIEIKSGSARESKRQKLIKNCIKKGMVRYEKIQINEHGIKILSADNEK